MRTVKTKEMAVNDSRLERSRKCTCRRLQESEAARAAREREAATAMADREAMQVRTCLRLWMCCYCARVLCCLSSSRHVLTQRNTNGYVTFPA